MRILILLVAIVFQSGCVTGANSKIERDAHGSIIREDSFNKHKDQENRIEQARKDGVIGILRLSDEKHGEQSIGEVIFNGAPIYHSKEFRYLIRFKLDCGFTIGTSMPFKLPVRNKEFIVRITNIKSGQLEDPKKFPTKLITSQDGLIEFSISTNEEIGPFQLELENAKGKIQIDSTNLDKPTTVPGSFCER